MSNNWVVGLLQQALDNWSNMLKTLWTLITTSPQEVNGGAAWSVIKNIHSGLTATGYALLVLFFVIGVVKTTTSWQEIKRPEQAIKLFIRFALAKGAITYGMELLTSIFKIAQGVITSIAGHSGTLLTETVTLPDTVQQKILECGFGESIPLWIVALLAVVLVTVLSVVMILSVYSRFFTLYMYTALAPIPLSTFAGEGTSQIGRQFIKSYMGVCLQGAVIALACVIYTAFASSPPTVFGEDATAVEVVWSYMTEIILYLLILVGAVKTSDRVVKEMIGF